MKIHRLMGILIQLSGKDKVTAPYLAQYFNVSKRTINRDIEALCMAGVPIITRQGNNGGISIQEGYKLDNNIFNKDEVSQIITGLKALESVNATGELKLLIDKMLIKDNKSHISDDIVRIELGSFYKDSLAEKIRIIKNSANNSCKISFNYYSKNGFSQKTVEPYLIIYKWKDWYLYAYSQNSSAFRLYKLNRLWNLKETTVAFTKREVSDQVVSKLDDIFDSNYKLVAIFDKSVEYSLVENYGPNCYKVQDDGRLLFEMDFTNFEFMLNWILSFGENVTVLEPATLIQKLMEISQLNLSKYN